MVDFVKLAKTAKKLVEATGRSVTLYKRDRTPAVAGDPWRGPDSVPTPSDGLVIGPLKVAFVPATGGGFGKLLFDADKTLRRKIDLVGLLATDSVVALSLTAADVEVADTLKDGAKIYKIVEIGHLKPGDTSLLLVLGLKL
jgi:hypothetical protein